MDPHDQRRGPHQSHLHHYYFSDFDTRLASEDEKKQLVAVFARHSLNGKITVQEFERLKLAVEYYDDIPPDLVTDPTTISILDWLRGGLSTKWNETRIACPNCRSQAIQIANGEKAFLVCPECRGMS